MPTTDIPQYLSFLSDAVLKASLKACEPAVDVPDLMIAKGLQKDFPDIETAEALQMVCDVYVELCPILRKVLEQRRKDRLYIDRETRECVERNQKHERHFHDPEYETVIGKKDEDGRIVVGPHTTPPPVRRVKIPEFLQGEHVTLFGPPDTEKLSINAMNALHQKLPDEAEIVGELIDELGDVPRWGADNEDSKTPIMRNYLKACRNLIGCFDHSLEYVDPKNGKHYKLVEKNKSIPIKRIPGLAMPDGNHLYKGNPLPLHMFDFVLHMVHNWRRPKSLIFYVPKLENEEEAAYLRALIVCVERKIKRRHPDYQIGSVGLFVVFENPRAIFRIREMADALFPYFIGGSLGWHDFLASTARLFKNDPNYRIPVKADPNIVINHIKESHDILVSSLAPIGAVCIGGMYGTLYENGNQASFEVSIVGYVKDVISQLKRGLNGFWVAHPNFVRLGLALVSAWRRREKNSRDRSLETFIEGLVATPEERDALLRFIDEPDVHGLSSDDPLYLRSVLAADLNESHLIANNDPVEIRYNIFQALQYLTDWLCGNGCVALPTHVVNLKGESVFVRIMDDLATTERSRWELWAEVHHGRISVAEFDALLDDEYDGIRSGKSRSKNRIQVPYDDVTKKWYPIARSVLRELVVTDSPVEFVPQLVLPYTLEFVRRMELPKMWLSENQ